MSSTDEKPHNVQPEIDELTKDKYLGGHEYDGIRELDNKLPRWWLWLFYITIIFAAVYLLDYHVFHYSPSQKAEYQAEMDAAAKLVKPVPVFDVSTLTVLSDKESLDAGKEIFMKICSTCHGKNGEGLVGPNMTDKFWIHGNTIQDMFKIVQNGVIEKGMLPFKDQYTPKQIQDVLSYIISLQGTNPANQKAPQGTEYPAVGM
jgi:cytochrome c oxidase cbb3-type subunit III